MTEPCPSQFVDLAARLADAAGEVARRYFRRRFEIETKSDSSPVTTADREAETTMRALIEREQPTHGILGEEFADARAGAEYLWILDPIDGTKAFASGLPVFAILIGLLHRGRPVLGVIDQPILGERWIGAAGRATTLNGHEVQARRSGDLSLASLHATSPEMFRHGDDMARFERLRDAVRFWHYGAESYAYGLLAAGHLELVVEATMKVHDYLPLVAVVEGAGGVISDWQGRPLGLESDGHVLAAANPDLHRAALSLLGG